MVQFSLLISLMTVFLHVCTWEGMLLARVPVWLWNAPRWIKKPLYDCPVCMTPWWGSLIIVVFGLLTGYWPHWWVWVCQVAAAGGINAVLSAVLTGAAMQPGQNIEVITANDPHGNSDAPGDNG